MHLQTALNLKNKPHRSRYMKSTELVIFNREELTNLRTNSSTRDDVALSPCAGVVRASSIFPILSAILLLLGGVCVASSGFYKSKRNIILGGGILFVAAGNTAASSSFFLSPSLGIESLFACCFASINASFVLPICLSFHPTLPLNCYFDLSFRSISQTQP